MNELDRLLDRLNAILQPRILRLSFLKEDAPAARLLPNRFKGIERMSRGFEYTVELLSDDANISLEDMHGKLLWAWQVTADDPEFTMAVQWPTGRLVPNGSRKLIAGLNSQAHRHRLPNSPDENNIASRRCHE